MLLLSACSSETPSADDTDMATEGTCLVASRDTDVPIGDDMAELAARWDENSELARVLTTLSPA